MVLFADRAHWVSRILDNRETIMSKEMSYQGRLVAVVEVKGGWTTILDGMKQLKVRNSELTSPAAGRANVPAKPGPVRSAKDRPVNKVAKEAKAPKPARDPAAEDTRLVRADTARYVITDDVKTASGRKAIDIGDATAQALRGADLADTYRAASEATGRTQKSLRESYEHLNPGMQRMNLGNLIRGAAAKAAREAAKAAKAA